MKSNKHTATAKKHSGKRKEHPTKTNDTSTAKKFCQNSCNGQKVISVVHSVAPHFGPRIDSNKPLLHGIDITNEEEKRVSAQSVIHKIFQGKSHDRSKSLIERVEQLSGMNLEKFSVGRRGLAPKVMNVVQFRKFIAELPKATQLSEDEKVIAQNFPYTDTYIQIVAALEDSTRKPADLLQHSASIVQMRDWFHQFTSKKSVSPNDEQFAQVQQFISSNFPCNPQITELHTVNKHKNQEQDKENIKFVAFTNSSYCMNINGDHECCCVCFTISPKGFRQRCFHQTATGPELCANYQSESILPPMVTNRDSVLMQLLSTGSRKNKAQRELFDMLAPNLSGDFFFNCKNPEDFKKNVHNFLQLRIQRLNTSTGGVQGGDTAKVQRERAIISQCKGVVQAQKQELSSSESFQQSIVAENTSLPESDNVQHGSVQILF